MSDVERALEVLLREYPPQLKMLRRAEHEKPYTLYGQLQTDPQWAYKSDGEDSPINHFTLAEAVFSTNQMAYVLASCIAQDGGFQNIKPATLEEFNQKKFNDMMITKFSAEFKKPFLSTEWFKGIFRINDYVLKRTKTGIYIFMNNEFSFEESKSYGASSSVIRLREEDLIDPGKI